MSGRPLPTTNVGVDYELMEGTVPNWSENVLMVSASNWVSSRLQVSRRTGRYLWRRNGCGPWYNTT